MGTTNSIQEFTPERVGHLAHSIKDRLNESINGIEEVNNDIHVLSINAKIQAARAGTVGMGFGVVADEIRNLVHRTRTITSNLQVNVEDTIRELMTINELLGTKVRGQRLAQVAHTCIDIVDRNLYERSCDVRWWATEDTLAAALENPHGRNLERAGERLSVILDSYTVYLDLVLCDLAGKVLANGRAREYASEGKNVKDTEWFQQALRSTSGNQFGFAGVHESTLVNQKTALVYSCAVRREGKVQGEIIGVLGIIFNWTALGDVVVKNAQEMLAPETENKVEVCLVYPDGRVISSSEPQKPSSAVPMGFLGGNNGSTQGYVLDDSHQGAANLTGYAHSVGFETYKTGWSAVIMETQR